MQMTGLASSEADGSFDSPTSTCLDRTRQSPRGFTALELIIVIALVAILMAVAIPWYLNYQDQQRLRVALSQVEADLRNAQVKSKSTSTPYDVVFNPNAPNNTYYSIYRHPESGLQTLVATVPIPGNVVISNITYQGNEPNTITYYQPVFTKETDGGTITLRSPNGLAGRVVIAMITGRVATSIP